jgi:hypothetical protein
MVKVSSFWFLASNFKFQHVRASHATEEKIDVVKVKTAKLLGGFYSSKGA